MKLVLLLRQITESNSTTEAWVSNKMNLLSQVNKGPLFCSLLRFDICHHKKFEKHQKDLLIG